MKIGSIVHALAAHRDLKAFLVHTGQHYDAAMSEQFFKELNIPEPDVNLGVAGGSHGAMTAAVLTELETLLVQRDPAAVLVVGDVNSTIAAALAAAKWAFRWPTSRPACDRSIARCPKKSIEC